MIYAAIDVDLQHHDKAILAGSAMYLWTFCMLWSRSQKGSGHVPMHVILACPWANRSQNKSALARLLDSGLWLAEDNGVRIWNYGNKNDTRETIEKRIESTKDRQASFRKRRNALLTRESHMALGAGAGALSVSSGSDLSEGMQGEPKPAPATMATVPALVLGESSPAPADIPVTPELVARCKMAGAPEPTREHVQTMLAYSRSKRTSSFDWGAEVVKWMLRQKRFDRDKPSGKHVVQSAEGRCWQPGEDYVDPKETGT